MRRKQPKPYDTEQRNFNIGGHNIAADGNFIDQSKSSIFNFNQKDLIVPNQVFDEETPRESIIGRLVR